MRSRQIGEKNPNCKLSDDDVELMRGFFKSCNDEIDGIDSEIERLSCRRRQLVKQRTGENIADMFGISQSHAWKVIKNEER